MHVPKSRRSQSARSLALLLSSYFIYNSVGTIDGAAVSKLSLVVNLTKHIHVRSQSTREDSGTEYNQFFPHFLWVGESG